MLQVALLGAGEVAQAFAAAFAQAGVRTTLYKRAPVPAALRDWAAATGVELADSASGAVRGADLVLSCVVSTAAAEVAEAAAPGLEAGCTYLDLNSCRPSDVEAAAAAVTARGATLVDGVMVGGGIALEGYRALLLLSGPTARELHDRLATLGFNTRVVGERVGQASAIKMIRGVVVKGLIALLGEMLLAARAYDLEEEVFSQVIETIREQDFAAYASLLVTSSVRHGARRADEMALVADTVRRAGVQPLATNGCLERLRHWGSLPLAEHLAAAGAGDASDWRAVLKAMAALEKEGEA